MRRNGSDRGSGASPFISGGRRLGEVCTDGPPGGGGSEVKEGYEATDEPIVP